MSRPWAHVEKVLIADQMRYLWQEPQIDYPIQYDRTKRPDVQIAQFAQPASYRDWLSQSSIDVEESSDNSIYNTTTTTSKGPTHILPMSKKQKHHHVHKKEKPIQYPNILLETKQDTCSLLNNWIVTIIIDIFKIQNREHWEQYEVTGAQKRSAAICKFNKPKTIRQENFSFINI